MIYVLNNLHLEFVFGMSLSTVTFAYEVLPLPLSPSGKIMPKEIAEAFRSNCRSTRIYPVIEGLPNSDAQSRLNATLKRLMSVGRKLKPADCPEVNSNELYEYHNSYFTGSQRGPYVGLQFSISFPGGSGRTLVDCHIFNLESGKEFSPLKEVRSDALKSIQEIAKQQKIKFDSKFEPEGLVDSRHGKTYSPFCLEADGVAVLLTNDGKFGARHIVIPENMYPKIFIEGAFLKALLQK